MHVGLGCVDSVLMYGKYPHIFTDLATLFLKLPTGPGFSTATDLHCHYFLHLVMLFLLTSGLTSETYWHTAAASLGKPIKCHILQLLARYSQCCCCCCCIPFLLHWVSHNPQLLRRFVITQLCLHPNILPARSSE